MIVPISGNVSYPITLDPTVWIFDDRKIMLKDAFSKDSNSTEKEDELEKAAIRWDQEIYQHVKPPVNKSISKFEREKILVNTYVMPIHDFIEHAEVKPDAKRAVLHNKDGEVAIPLKDLKAGYLLFSVEGKPIKKDGPTHFYYQDGSNSNNPIKGVYKITIE